MPVHDGALTVLIAGTLANAVLAGIPGLRQILAAPGAAVDGIASWLDRRLNRPGRSTANRAIRGGVVALLVLVLGVLAGRLVEAASAAAGGGPALAIAALAALVVPRPGFDGLRAVARAAPRGVEAERAALAASVVYDTAGLDRHAVARGAIEAAMARLCEGFVAPAFWFLVLGLPAACACRAIGIAADRMVRPGADQGAFGTAVDGLDRLLNLVPAPVAGLLIALAALFVPGARPGRAVATLARDWRRHPQPSKGWTLAAAAGALGLALGGPRRYGGLVAGGPWIGDGRARANPSDVARAAWLYVVVVLLGLGGLAAAMLGLAR